MAATPKPTRKLIKKMSSKIRKEVHHSNKDISKKSIKSEIKSGKNFHKKTSGLYDLAKDVRKEREAAHAHMKAHGG